MLRVHRKRLTRRDPEEVRVEVTGVQEESAIPYGRHAEGVVEPFEVPATVGGKPADDVVTGRDEAPQFLRRLDTTGEAAGHSDDRNGVVVCRCHRCGGVGSSGCPGRLPYLAGGCGQQVPGQGSRGGVVEDQGGGQRQPCRLGEPGAQFHGREGVETKVPERQVGLYLLRSVMSEDGCHVGAHQVEDDALLPRLVYSGEAACEFRLRFAVAPRPGPDSGRRGGRAGLGHLVQQRTWARHGEQRGESLPVDSADDDGCLVVVEGLPQGLEGQAGVEAGQPLA